MTKFELNRRNMYEDLLGLGYFKDEDGTIIFPFEEFDAAMADPDTVSTLYENLVSDGYYLDEDGNATVSQEDFVANLCDTRTILEYYPLTENQRGVYLDWEMNRNTTQYNIPNVFHFKQMDVEALVGALKATVNAHSYVKTRFVMRDGDVMQQRRDDEPVKVTVTTLDKEPDTAFFQARVRPFNPFNDDLYRLEVYVWNDEVYLFKDFHHLVDDGLSETVFFQDFVKAFSGQELIEESFSAFDFSLYEQAIKDSKRYSEAEQFFARLLNGVSSFKYPYSTEIDDAEPGANIGSASCQIAQTSAINELCHKLGITANSYFQTVATQVMHRLTREDSVVMATISNGRALSDMQQSIGMFVKTLPLVHTQQADFQKLSFAEAAKTMHEQNVNTLTRDFYPFTEIAQRYGVHPEILYAYQGGVSEGVTGGEDMGFETIPVSLDTAKMPIELTFCPDENGDYIVFLTYDTTLYSRHDIEALAKALATYAANASKEGATLGDIKMLSDEEQMGQIKLGQGKKLDYDIDETWVDMFKRVVAATPESVAVADAERSLTYGELDRQSDVLASILLENDVEPNAFVCTMMDRTVFFPVTVLGLHKVAAAYTPLDMEYPNERLCYMVENSESKVLITTHADLESKIAEGGLKIGHMRIIYLDDIDFSVAAEPVCLAKPDNNAYMIYTSGSTGLPKGTILHHRGLRNYIPSLIDFFGVSAKDRISHHRPFSFDAHLTDFYPPLASGGQLHIMPAAIRKNLEEIYRFIVDRGITGGSFTTSLGAMLLDNYKLPMRYVALSGEKMVGLVSGDVQLFNAYGPTECTDLICIHKLERDRNYRAIPIGKPMPNSLAVLLDSTGNIVPEGVAGELCFLGPQVGYGYLKLPEKTDSVFIDIKKTPFFHLIKSAAPDVLRNASRIYHTGDLCKWNSENVLECLGRIDNQIKLRGFRVELGEIEAQAKDMPGVEKVVAQVREVAGAQHLVLYYKKKECEDVDEQQFRLFFEQTELAEYMRPEIYCCLDEFPYLPNGKVNKRMLPEPVIGMEDAVAPETEFEQQVFDIVKEILKHDKFGVTTNLVSVGLTSLSAMRLVATVAQKLSLNVTIADVMANPTIRGIINANADDKGQAQLKHYERRDSYPLTENQRGVYLDWEMHRDTTQYNLPYLYHFTATDANRLADALRSVINAHSYLKTRFVMKDGDVMQIPNDDEPVEIPIQNVDGSPSLEFFSSMVRPFNVLGDRLYRVGIYAGNAGEAWLFWDIHHLVFDGLSTSLFMHEVLEAYNGVEIQPEKVTAFDFALYEQELMQSDVFSKAEARFDKLVGGASALNYPLSAETDEDKSGGNVVKAFIPSSPVDAFCSRNGVTPNSYLHAAFGEAMSRLTREETPLYLTLSNGRSAGVEMQRCMGMFVKTLPVVMHGGDRQKHLDQSVADYVKEVHSQLQETYALDFYPYTRIVERHGYRSGVMFIYQGGLFEGGAVESVEQVALPLDTIKFPVNMISYPDGDSYVLSLEYDDDSYSRNDMMSLVNAVANAAISMAAAERVGDIRLLDEAQEKALVALSKGEILEYDTNATWLSLFKAQVAEHPDALAVCDAVSSVTYRDLDEQSDRLASYLVANGVKPNDFVGIQMDRCKEFIVAIIGIHKTGAAYLPLDPEYPQSRIDYMLEDSGAKVVVDSAAFEASQEAGGLFCESLATPESLAYIIYTSGSTGKPKGVLLTHRGLMNFTVATIGINGLTAADRISSHRSFSFDAHIEDVYPVLSVGASIHVMPSEIRKDLGAIRGFLADHEITGGGYTTSIARLLLDNYDLKQRFITCGGEALTGVVSDKVQIINVYGPTECTDHSAVYHLEKGRSYKNIPIGRPMANSYCFILDGCGNLQPQGVAGELCYSGPQRGNGYLHLEDNTREVFTTVNICGKDYEIYRTGDLARYNEEGLLECLGRIDNQVKLRGYRIETGEIEDVAMMFGGVYKAVAHVRDVNGQPHLVLYYTLKDGSKVTGDALRSFVEASSLAVYMRPEFYVQLDAIPSLPNGKVDYKSLPQPQLRSGEMVKPETDTEKAIFEVVAEFLKFDDFGVTDNLVSLGLSSLSGMRLSAAIHQKCGKTVTMADIMSAPTLREMASKIDTNDLTSDIRKYAPRDAYPLTENQRGVYLDWEMHRDTTQYNLPHLYHFTTIDAGRLGDAVRAVINAHSYLKTRFAFNDGDVVQMPHEDEPVDMLFQNVDENPGLEFFRRRVRPFDVLRDRLYRVEIYAGSAGETWLFLDIHHLVFDGLSTGLFLHEVMEAYNGSEIQPETVTAFDFALYERELLQSDAFTKAEARFDKLVGDATALSYPVSAEPDGDKSEGNAVKAFVPSALVDAFCSQNGVTPNSFLHAAFGEVMSRFTREETPLYLTISNGRGASVGLQRCMGMFVKTLPVVVNNADLRKHLDQCVVDYVKEVHSQLQETYGLEFYPYTRIVERHGHRSGVMFVYQGGLFEGGAVEGVEQVALPLDTVKFPISVISYPDGGNYVLHLEYDDGSYSQKDMATLVTAIANAAKSLATADKVRDIRLLDEMQENAMLDLSRGETLEYDTNATWLSLFKAQVKKQPDALAVCDACSSVTYRELDEQSDRLASYLIAKGIKPDDFVGIHMDRCKEFIVTILGIHKVGAAYLPLDPEYPQSRVDYMLQDSGAKVVVDSAVFAASQELDGTFRDCLATPKSLAYIIYTSGSTGKPKGALLTHRGLMNFTVSTMKIFGYLATDRISAHRSFSFDTHIEDVYPVLSAGASMHVMPSEIRKDLNAIANFLYEHEITGGGYTTSIGRLLIENCDLKQRFIICGGEALAGVVSDKVQIYNEYGPTECTDDSSVYRLEKGRSYKNIPIGRPMPNSYCFILDCCGNLQPQGVAGELCYSGPQRGNGYLNLEEKTREVFTSVSLCGKDYEIYRTGDLARYNEEGQLECLGRIDNQVKLRGFRIELGEIESRATQYDGILMAVAVVKNGQTLCLYFTADTQIDTAALKTFLAETLADYMVPNVFMQLDEMPRTPSGKVDRKALPEPDMNLQLELVKPANEMEQKMFDIAKELLLTSEFGVTDSLFLVGMTSLIAMKYAIRLKNIGITATVASIMRYRNIRDILHGNIRLSWLYDAYDPTKPVLVFVHGIVSSSLTMARFEDWKEKFNVFVIEPIDAHYHVIFEGEDYEMVLWMYMSQLGILPEDADIKAFMGFSWGGKVALDMAEMYAEETGKKPLVILGDTAFNNATDGREMTVADVTPEQMEMYHGLISAEALTDKFNIVFRMERSETPQPTYDGPVVFLNAMKNGMTERKTDNLSIIKRLLPNVEIIDFPDCDHDDMYMRLDLNDKYSEIIYTKIGL